MHIASSSAETMQEAGAEYAYKQKNEYSLKIDDWIIGCKVYTDVAWNNTTDSRNNSRKIGIGIYIQTGEKEEEIVILISTTGKSVESPLRAKATVVQVAAEISYRIANNQITFLVDNLILARATASRILLKVPVHWKLEASFQITLLQKPTFKFRSPIFLGNLLYRLAIVHLLLIEIIIL